MTHNPIDNEQIYLALLERGILGAKEALKSFAFSKGILADFTVTERKAQRL